MKKLKFLIILFTAGISAGSLSSCRNHCVYGSGNQITRNRQVGNFTRLDVSESFKVIIREDSSSTINITADDNIIKFIKTNIVAGKLHIYTKKNMCNTGQIIIKVPVKLLEEVKASDAAEITSDGKILAKDISLKLSDGSRINLDLNATHVTTRASDASELILKGQAATHDIKISDGSKLNIPAFITGNSTVEASDGSYSELNVLNTLNVRASDGAVIKYHGNTANVNSNKSDGASVEKIN